MAQALQQLPYTGGVPCAFQVVASLVTTALAVPQMPWLYCTDGLRKIGSGIFSEIAPTTVDTMELQQQ